MNLTFSKPDFLVAGPFKTGTTWLYIQLCKVSGLSMPPYKEISFFYHADYKRYLIDKTARLDKGTWQPGLAPVVVGEAMKKEIWADYYNTLHNNFALSEKGGNRGWTQFYKLIPNSLNKFSFFLYSRLFDQSSLSITGDVSPYYFQLSEEAIEKIKASFPRLKIIFILRDPAEREWSNIKMNYFSARSNASFAPESYFSGYHMESDYKRAIGLWEKYFDRDNILYLFYDDLCLHPQRFMNTLLQFIAPGKPSFSVGTERIAVGVEKEMDTTVKRLLLISNLPQYEFLAEKFGGDSHAYRWKERALAEIKRNWIKAIVLFSFPPPVP